MTRATWRDRLIAADPGFSRLRTAVRSTMAVMIASWLLFELAARFGQKPAVPFIGIVVAMLSAQTINDELARQRRMSLLLLPLPVGATIIAAVLLSGTMITSMLGFLAVAFLAVATRGLGPRASAYGLTTLMTYFLAIYFQARVQDLPWMLIAVLVAVAISLVLRFVLLPDVPRWVLRWSVAAYRAREKVLAAALAEVAAAKVSEPGARDRVLRSLSALNEAALDLDDGLRRWREDGALALAGCRRLSTQVYEQELALARLVGTVSRFLPVVRRREEWHALARVVTDDVQRVGDEGERALGELERELERAGEREAATAVAEFRGAQRDWAGVGRLVFPGEGSGESWESWESGIGTSASAITSATTTARHGTATSATTTASAGAGSRAREWKGPVRLATQATVATGLAAGLGAAHSAATWAWAAFAAFIVFTGNTKGDALRRVAQRLGGTALGIVLGFGVARLATGHDAALGCIFASIFVAIYTTRVNYLIATTAFTVMIAVLYQMLGRLSDTIMLLRLEQTLVGVACGAAAAFFVFPVFTRGAIGTATAKVLRAVSAALQGHDPKLSRTMDREFQALRQIAGPMVARLPFGADRPASGLMHDVSALVHYTRLLTAIDDGGIGADHAVCVALGVEAQRQAGTVEAFVQTLRHPDLLHPSAPRGPVDASPSEHWASQVRLLLARIASRFESTGVVQAAPHDTV